MSVEQRLPDDHPMMVAWEAHKATETYANDVRWAVVPEHTEGALWSAFVAAWNRRAPSAELRAAAEEMRERAARGLDAKAALAKSGSIKQRSYQAAATTIRALPLPGIYGVDVFPAKISQGEIEDLQRKMRGAAPGEDG